MSACRRLLLTAITPLVTACVPSPRWIAVAGDTAVTVFDRDLRPVGRFPIPAGPRAMLFAPDGASLFVAVSPRPGSTLLIRVPRAGGVLEGRTLEGDARRLRLTPDGSVLLAALGGAAAGLAFTRAQTLAGETLALPCDVRDVVLTASADRAYVVCGEGRVAEVDPILRLVVKTAELPAADAPCAPAGSGLSANGTVLFVACAGSGWLLYLDRVTLDALDSVAVPRGATRFVIALGGRRALLTVPDDGSVVVADLPGRRIRGRTPVAGASDIGVSADGRRAFVVTATALLELDAAEGRVLRSIPLPQGASRVSVWPGPDEPRMRWDNGISASASGAPGGKS